MLFIYLYCVCAQAEMPRSRSSKRNRRSCPACGGCNTTMWREHEIFGEIFKICDNCHHEKQAREKCEDQTKSKSRTPLSPNREPPAKKSPRPLRKSPRLSPAVSKSRPKSHPESPPAEAREKISKPDPDLATVSQLETGSVSVIHVSTPGLMAPNISDPDPQTHSSPEKRQLQVEGRIKAEINISQPDSHSSITSNSSMQNKSRASNFKRKVCQYRLYADVRLFPFTRLLMKAFFFFFKHSDSCEDG